MENSISQTPNHEKIPGGINVDIQDLVLYFGSIKVGKDSNSGIEDTASQSNNASSSVSACHNQEEDAANVTDSKKIKNQCDSAQETSDKPKWLSENSVSDPGSIWGYRFFLTEGGGFASAVHNDGQNSVRGSKDCKDGNVDSRKPENFDAGSSSQQPRMESLCCNPSTSNFVSQFESSPLRYGDPSFMSTAVDDYEKYQFREVANDGLYSGIDYGTMNCDLTSKCQWNQQEIETFPEAEPQLDLNFLQEILESGNYQQIEMVLLIFQGSYLSLMMDKRMFLFFQKLIDACRVEQLDILVEEVLSCSQLFINAAFCKQGASAIVKLIKKIKKSNHASTVTEVLSTQFWAIMTNDVARVVIQDCFIYFGNPPNKILYELAICHAQDLAIHKVGCRALNETINTIAGEQRSRLLNHIADCAASLSNDPYGNYVVQNVLSLKNQDVSAMVVLSLRGQVVQLAKKSGGSHVIEKCMESSHFGTVSVVQEILDTPMAPFRLAQDNFGNYVIQKALKKTKEHGLSDLYDSFVKSLQPYCEALNQTAGGKNVLKLLKDNVRLEGKSSINGKKQYCNVVVDVGC